MRYTLLTCLMLILITSLSAIHDDAGTNGFNFYKINFAARSSAMGNALTGAADDADAVFFNIAGISQIDREIVSTAYCNYLMGDHGGTVTYVRPVKDRITAAIFSQFLTIGDIDKTTEDDEGFYTGTHGTFGSSDMLVGFGLGYKVSDAIRLGFSGKFLHESIDDKSASAIALDLGLLHQTTNENIKVGIALKNIGKQLTYFTDSEYDEGLPTCITAGVSIKSREVVLLNADINKPINGDIYVNLGIEGNYKKRLFLRAGYDTRSSDWDVSGDGILSGFSTGFGVNWKKYRFDYTYASKGDLGAKNQIGVVYFF